MATPTWPRDAWQTHFDRIEPAAVALRASERAITSDALDQLCASDPNCNFTLTAAATRVPGLPAAPSVLHDRVAERAASVPALAAALRSPLARAIFPAMSHYVDVTASGCSNDVASRPGSLQGRRGTALRLAAVHAANHIMRTRQRVLKNNAKMAVHRHRVITDVKSRRLDEALAAADDDAALPLASDDEDESSSDEEEEDAQADEADSAVDSDASEPDVEPGSDAADDSDLEERTVELDLSAAAKPLATADAERKRTATQAKRASAASPDPKRRRRTLAGPSDDVADPAQAHLASEGGAGVRDQGFVRPRVLVLAPFRQTALEFTKTWIQALPQKVTKQLHKYKRFLGEFEAEDPTPSPKKPAAYQHSFYGNVDDDFRLGIALTAKSVNFYSGFDRSDLIVASPVAIRQVVGTEADEDRDTGFLSSIEVLIVLDAHMLEMQNWEHLEHVMTALNVMPERELPRGADLNRVRAWALDGQMKRFRQSIMFTDWVSPEQAHFRRTFCHNFEGSLRLRATFPQTGSLSQITHSSALQLTFQRFAVREFKELFERRTTYFLKTVLPRLRRWGKERVLIFIPSYFAFVVVRNAMTKAKLDFVNCCEYSKTSIVTRGRAMFRKGETDMLLVTERFAFFKRHRIRGAKHVVFLGMPQNAELFAHVVNELEEPDKDSLVLSLFCPYDQFELERVVGLERTKSLVSSDNDVQVFAAEGNGADDSL